MTTVDRHLLALTWRTNRRRLIGWASTIAVLLAGSAAGVVGLYPTADDRAGYAATVGRSAATAAINGRGYDLNTLGGITAYEFGFISSVALPIIAGHLAIHLTRTQEDRGLLDLITASPVGRLQPLTAAIVVLVATITGTGVLNFAGMVSTGLPAAGSLGYAAALALLLATFAGVGLVAGQVATNGRTAHALLLTTVGMAYVVRAVVDGRDMAATWLTPTGWLAEVRPYGSIVAWPLVAMAAAAVATTAVALWVAAERDLGAGILAARSGPASAPAWVRSVPALTYRITRASLVGWMIGAATWGAAIGWLAPEMRSLVEDNPALADALGGEGAVVDLLAAMGLLVVALLATGALLQWIAVLAGEESSGRVAIMTAAPLSRSRWWWWSLIVVSAQAALVLLVGVGGQVVGTGLSGSGWSPSLLLDAVSYLPAVLVVGLVAAAGQGLRPGGVAVGWAVLGWVTVVALLGETIGLPLGVRRTSPFELTGRLPVDARSPGVLASLTLVAVVLAVAGRWAFTRRDLAV